MSEKKGPVYRKAAQDLVRIHHEEGVGVGRLVGAMEEDGGVTIVNVTPDDLLLAVGGRELTTKLVRKYLFDRRHIIREVQASGAVPLVMSRYDEEMDRSFVGITAMTSEEHAQAIAAHQGVEV